MTPKTQTLMAVGDIVPGSETAAYFDDVLSILTTSDVLIGQLEVAHSDKDPKSWARRSIERFGFVPDPDYPTYPFHPDAIYTIIAKCQIENKKISRASYIPLIVKKRDIPRSSNTMRRDSEPSRTWKRLPCDGPGSPFRMGRG